MKSSNTIDNKEMFEIYVHYYFKFANIASRIQTALLFYITFPAKKAERPYNMSEQKK